MAREDRFIHKHGYAYLFSNPVIVRELIESFVNAEFAAQLDFSDFESYTEKTYITDDFSEYADDLLAKVKLNGEDAYIYLLIEFQSSPDRFMALRFLNYLCLFYLDHLKLNPGLKTLPPVMPILLYNGTKNWTAPDNIRDLIVGNDFVQQFYPDFKYFQIIEKEFDSTRLKEIGNVVSAIFLIENTPKEQFERITQELALFLDDSSAQAIGLLAVWIKALLKNKKVEKSVLDEIVSLKNTKEAKSMIVETLNELKQDWYTEGRQEGRQEGERAGIIQTAKSMKKLGVDIEIIKKSTGLSDEEIKAL